jgi:hypothetical protein
MREEGMRATKMKNKTPRPDLLQWAGPLLFTTVLAGLIALFWWFLF